MNTIRNDRSNLFRLLAATIFFAVGIISTTHAQLNNLGVFNEYYSDYVLVDSIAVTCMVHLPEGDSAPMGITKYHITLFSGNEEKQIFNILKDICNVNRCGKHCILKRMVDLNFLSQYDVTFDKYEENHRENDLLHGSLKR